MTNREAPANVSRKWNWRIWSGFLLAAAGGLLVAGVRSAFANPEVYRGKIVGLILAVLSFGAAGLDPGVTNAINPDLRGFFRHGGKLLQYHGWNDPGISPFNSIDYYNSVLKFMGGADKANGSYRLFMVPGMDHCAFGEGPNTFDAIGAIEQWVEQGKAPERVVASRWTDGKVDRTRPLCPYPQVAKYRGTGSSDDEANFACRLQ